MAQKLVRRKKHLIRQRSLAKAPPLLYRDLAANPSVTPTPHLLRLVFTVLWRYGPGFAVLWRKESRAIRPSEPRAKSTPPTSQLNKTTAIPVQYDILSYHTSHGATRCINRKSGIAKIPALLHVCILLISGTYCTPICP